jgi:hypothetical protein
MDHVGATSSRKATASTPTMLKALLRERNWHSYAMFKRAYIKTAKKLDPSLAGAYPSDRTYKRWVSGRIKDLPRAEHCAVLEAMLPGWSASELFQPYTQPGDGRSRTLLSEFLRQRRLQNYHTFRKNYDDAARRVDSTLVGTYPNERQFYDWASGEVTGLPHADHGNILEAMFPGSTVRQLFGPYEQARDAGSVGGQVRVTADRYADKDGSRRAGGQSAVCDGHVTAEGSPRNHGTAELIAPADPVIVHAVSPAFSHSDTYEHHLDPENGMKRRQILKFIGAGAALGPLTQQATGPRDMVLNAAHSSTILQSAMNTPKIADATLDEVRQDLHQLATDYVVTAGLDSIFSELVILRDRLYVLLDRYGKRPRDARELHLLLGSTCVLLASISHDLAEPRAAMIQTRAALTFAELAGHAGLQTWVHCTRAMIASWWNSPDDVLHHARQSRITGQSGIGAIRLAGLEARALAQSGQHGKAADLLHAAHDQRDKLPITDSLRDLGEVFTFSPARQHYYNAATFAHMHDWQAVEKSVSTVVNLYGTMATGQCWPVTMTLSHVYLAQARLNRNGPEGAWGALVSVLEIPKGQRIPQIIQALNGLRMQLRSEACASLPAARDLDEAVHSFCATADGQGRQ